MSIIKTLGPIVPAATLTALALPGPAFAKDDLPDPSPRVIELAICLDTSGSMSGLIESAKQKLWAIVNELAMAEPTPRLRVALLTYGNDGHPTEEGWVNVDSPLTEDLDLISQRLFVLSTNGGTEYVGRVLNTAGTLDWDPSEDSLKLAVVAGNEEADQDKETPYQDVCRALIARGIMVNAIYCGPVGDTIAPGWREVSQLADGQFATIDHDHGTVVVETPFDEELSALSSAVNETYIPFGAEGAEGAANQAAQDTNAAKLNKAAAASRAQTKAQTLYFCSWDLVDACSRKQVDLAEIPAEELPESMQKMTLEERKAHVASLGERRAEIQESIKEVSAKRQAFIAAKIKGEALDESQALDVALRTMIRAQACTKGFAFPENAGGDTEG
jgi:hypothetical protein